MAYIYTPYNHCFYIYTCVFMQSNLVLYQFMQSLVTEIATITCFTVTLKQHYLEGLIKQTAEIKIHYSKGVEGPLSIETPRCCCLLSDYLLAYQSRLLRACAQSNERLAGKGSSAKTKYSTSQIDLQHKHILYDPYKENGKNVLLLYGATTKNKEMPE